MSGLNKNDVLRVKGMGFLRNRGTDLFSGRIVAPGTVFTAENFKDMSYIAESFGNGKLICTSRQAVEIPGIPFEKINDAVEYAEAHSLYFGGTGNKVRPVTACKGTTCVYGNFDTQALATEIHEKFYVGWKSVVLPHKFKISVGGCPNSCIKPSLNDFGVEGHCVPEINGELCRGCARCAVEEACPMKAARLEDGKLTLNGECNDCGVCIGKCPFKAVAHEGRIMYKIFVGGTWGKKTRMGTPLSRLVTAEEVLPLLEKSLLWFRENGYAKERFGVAIDRVGFDSLEKALFGDSLIRRRDEILAAEIKTR